MRKNKEEDIVTIEILVIIVVLLIIGIELYVKSLVFEDNLIQETIYLNIPMTVNEKNNGIDIKIKNEEIYLALNDNTFIEYSFDMEKDIEDKVIFSSLDENIARVNEVGLVMGCGEGETKIIIQLGDLKKEIKVTVTNLINIKPIEPNDKKNLLACNRYTKEENDLLDKILENRVKEAGLGTRGGAVAAARFLTLEFPYKISYFSENGRLETNNVTYYVDGEGRYYHKGLYLNASRFDGIIKSLRGPNIWGCNIYMNVVGENRRNGLDCSGFITWVLVNGGYDPGDIGAGITSYKDMTDLGNKISIKEALNNDSLKVGDLLSGPKLNGGHIAILVGINDGKYYVAESLWGVGGTFGVVLKTYNKNNMYSYFKWQIDMDNFYQNEGEYNNYWR
ncbi:MAG: C40 family peptidase [Ruminococcus sp.]|nr:C40 family peptidase [Ruminococcus sp.]